MSILAAFMVPHPPMIVPEVGRGSEKQVLKTILAYERVADEVAALAPDTLIVTSPHAVMYADYFHISPGRTAAGSLGRFGAPGVRFSERYDTDLVKRICELADEAGFPTGTRAVFIASGDLSHKLQPYGPYGFAPEGPEYDRRIMDVCERAAFGELFDFDETFCDTAAESYSHLLPACRSVSLS